jgi:hypothetical protein
MVWQTGCVVQSGCGKKPLGAISPRGVFSSSV